MPNTEVQFAYQVCPIILVGGIASEMQGGMLPIVNLLYPAGSGQELPYDIGGINGLDDAFGAFNVLPGGTLISQQIGKYPMANQWVAANAVIEEPLSLSVIMDSPMRGPDAWRVKLTVFSALKASLDQHNNAGGMYTIVTPAYIYENCVMLSLTDNSRGNNSLPQNAWRFDFEKPLVTIQDLQGAQNSLMSKISNSLPTGGNVTGFRPGEQAAHPEITGTMKVKGYTVGGNPRILGSSSTPAVYNYPSVPLPDAFPFRGIS
jgi:hypothetical protein